MPAAPTLGRPSRLEARVLSAERLMTAFALLSLGGGMNFSSRPSSDVNLSRRAMAAFLNAAES
jgi:hypothetical protein